MTVRRMIQLLMIERECVFINTINACDRDCANCGLVQEDMELIDMYSSVIKILERVDNNENNEEDPKSKV